MSLSPEHMATASLERFHTTTPNFTSVINLNFSSDHMATESLKQFHKFNSYVDCIVKQICVGHQMNTCVFKSIYDCGESKPMAALIMREYVLRASGTSIVNTHHIYFTEHTNDELVILSSNLDYMTARFKTAMDLLALITDYVHIIHIEYIDAIWAVWMKLSILSQLDVSWNQHNFTMKLHLELMRSLYCRHDFVATSHRRLYIIPYATSNGRRLRCFAVLNKCAPSDTLAYFTIPDYSESDIDNNYHMRQDRDVHLGGGRTALTVTRDVLDQHRCESEEPEVLLEESFRYVAHLNTGEGADLIRLHPEYVRCALPLNVLVECLTVPQIRTIANIHGVKLQRNESAKNLRTLFDNHTCAKCASFTSVFCPSSLVAGCSKADISEHDKKELVKMQNKNRQQKARNKKTELYQHSNALKLKSSMQTAKLWADYKTKNRMMKSDKPVFPPAPPSKRLQYKIIKNWTTECDPSNFEEAGCAVCGILWPLKQMTKIEELKDKLDMSILVNAGVTRKERTSKTDAVEDLPGPILDDACHHICVECELSLGNNNMPINALANGIWIGAIPEQLRDLTFAECLLIAKIRHNRCLIRVSSGRAKMTANVVMFANPILKIYKVLPPSREDLEEILAFIFTGPTQPGPEEIERTPMLVRRNKVANALEWLKLNHKDYQELEISQTNLESYPLKGVVVDPEYIQQREESTLR